MVDVTDSALSEVYQEIRNDKNETNWALAGYESNTKVVLKSRGTGGLHELLSTFEDNEAQYAYLRVTSGDTESRRTKFVFISWCGPSVGALKRAKMSVHKASVKSVWKDYAIEIHGENHEELSEEIVMQKVRKAGGADYSGNLSGQTR